MDHLHAAFDAAMHRLLPEAAVRPEQPEDRDFLLHLFVACSPLAGMLPAAMLTQQAELANRGFASAFPSAMFRILLLDRQPIGRIAIDWSQMGAAHCIDLAVLPDYRGSRRGIAMLQAWLTVADEHGLVGTLEVLADNPARQIYERLGFRPTGEMDETHAVIEMVRPAAPDPT